MRMPGLDGAALLAEVQARWPGTARIVLSGQADVEAVMAVVRSAQKFLAKPCDIESLLGAVERTLDVRRQLTDPKLRSVIGGIDSVPILSDIYHELVAAMNVREVDLNRIADVIAGDVATTADLLKLVNSAFFTLPREVTSVRTAVSLLGLDNIQALVVAGQVFRVSDELDGRLDVRALQVQALTRAGIARSVAHVEGWPAHERDIAALSCMLRDVGRLVLVEGLPDQADALARDLAARPLTTPAEAAALEREYFGCTVSQASAHLLGLWAFAPAVAHTVAGFPLDPGDDRARRGELVLEFASRCVVDEYVTWPDLTADRARDDHLRRWTQLWTGAGTDARQLAR
ncbi:HD-like signal output (HDOD) protein [Kineosporia succinea]|uniref:HD-like signal output (HDOD) protein n=2 Tax=Kineosporia succinea TaxID=84632 RepID=A0ABT9NXN3_9ACTN|nr:HD-like signal output (HDOD) protein [Kineosporia succinea]